VTDYPFFAPNFRAPRRERRPREPLWSIRQGASVWWAELRFQDRAPASGWEWQIFWDAEFVAGVDSFCATRRSGGLKRNA
jgi:hypothetical protein